MPAKKTLEQEAEEFKQKKAPLSKPRNSTALRYYMGCALGGLLASGVRGRSDEVLQEALKYAKLAADYEDNF